MVIQTSCSYVDSKIKDKTGGVGSKKHGRLKPKMYCFLIVGSSDYKKANGVNKNIFLTISHMCSKMFCLIRNV